MSWKKLNNIILAVIIIIDISYVINLNYSASQSVVISSNGIGPSYFPNLLAAILLLLCIIVLIQGNKSEDTKVKISNIKYMLFTFILTALFILSWQFVGYFYLNVFVFITILMTIYRKEFGIKRSFFVGVFTSLITTGLLYVLFGKILVISL